MKRKVIVVILCMASLSQTLTVTAAEEETTDAVMQTETPDITKNMGDTQMEDTLDTDVLGTDIDSVFQSMRESMLAGETISISDAFNSLSSQQISQENMFDMSGMDLDGSFDSGLVNIQYQELADRMMDSTALLDTSGQSLNCISLFQDTYGDVLNEIALEEPTIPEDFTVQAMLQEGQDAINEAYADVTSTGDFATVKNSISIGNIFSIAEQGLSMPDLESGETLSGMLSSLNAGNQREIYQENQQAKSALSGFKDDYKQDMVANTKENLLNMADIIDNSAIYPDEGEKQLDNVAYHLDSLVAARRANSPLGKIATSIKDFGGNILDGIKDAAGSLKDGAMDLGEDISDWWDCLWD